MALTSTKTIVDRALGLADVGTDAEYIDYNDRTNSLNEAYKDIYARLTHSDDDYYVKEIILSPTNAQLSPNGNPNEYLLTLPEDVYKLRFVDYKGSTNWIPMRKFNPGMKDFTPSETMYRWSGDKLWVIGSSFTGLMQIKVTYYPPPAYLTLQKPTYLFDTNSDITHRRYTTKSQPLYLDDGKTLVYNIQHAVSPNTLVADSIDNNTVTAIYTSLDNTTPMTHIQYANGYLFWLEYMFGTNLVSLRRANWEVGTTMGTPTTSGIANNVVDFSITYDTTGYTIYAVTDTGTTWVLDIDLNVTNMLPGVDNTSYVVLPNDLYWVTATGILTNTVGAQFSNVRSAVGDGTFIYVLFTDNKVGKFEPIYNDTQLTWDLTLIGYIASNVKYLTSQNIIPIFETESFNTSYYLGISDLVTSQVQAVNSDVTSNLDYPLNAVYELMSYQSAIDFKRKQSAETGELEKRYLGLLKRFEDSIKRDEYAPERIQNFYSRNGNNGFGW